MLMGGGGGGGGGGGVLDVNETQEKAGSDNCKMSDLTLCTFNIIFSDKQLLLNWITFRKSE